jgi:hypothetical protein
VERRRQFSKKRLIVPVALAVTVVGTLAAALSTTACGDDKPRIDASVGDGGVDTPII